MKRNCVLPLCLGAMFACVPAKPQERTQITLEDLVRTSLNRNREMLALRQRVAQARGLARQAGVHPAPSIEAEGLSGRPLGSPGDQEFSAAFVQPVEAFGKGKNRVRVAVSAVPLAEAELDERSTRSRMTSRRATCRLSTRENASRSSIECPTAFGNRSG